MTNNKEKIEDWDKEEWGAWKIVSDMLDNQDEIGICPTSVCYQKLYEFVVKQKQKAKDNYKKELIKEIENEIKEESNLEILTGLSVALGIIKKYD